MAEEQETEKHLKEWKQVIQCINKAEGRGSKPPLNRKRLVRSPSYRDGVEDTIEMTLGLIAPNDNTGKEDKIRSHI